MTAVDIRIYEVGPRDGLQAEPTIVATEDKLRFLGMLADAGLREIETTSLVSPRAIPQLADAEDVLRALDRRAAVRYPVLVPNQRGLDRAVAAGVDAICLMTEGSPDLSFSPEHPGAVLNGRISQLVWEAWR